jgi:hypothetical protein
MRALTDLPAGLQEIRVGRTTPQDYLRSLAGKTVFSAFDWRDPLPATHDLGAHVARALRSHSRPAGEAKADDTAEETATPLDEPNVEAARSGLREAAV